MATYHNATKYKARIVNAILSESKGSKTPQFEISLKLLDEEIKPNAYEPYPIEDRFPPVVYMSVTDSTMGDKNSPGWVTRVMMHIGFNFDTWDCDSLIGCEGVVECRHEVSQYGTKAGQQVEKWSIWAPHEGGDTQRANESNPAVVRALKAKFWRQFAQLSGATPQTHASDPQTNGQPKNDEDDIPF